ncbi:unnamed protein product [Rhizoctonia solani]|uniref:N-acetylglucosaminylphosphatidylinositol deacetylase n=1 Tax=Rhizoctonia solani TaxID=456999 RepID=A0A8H3HD38_9AGAM|nr:unnamed protein product [Rhizoctonia solani]
MRRSRLKPLLLPSLVLLLLLYLLRSSGAYPNTFDIPSPILVLTAHPDDECMFFSPTILALKRQQKEVRGLCLSVGNADGLGPTRTQELVSSYRVLGLQSEEVDVLDHPELQDDIKTMWNESLIVGIVGEYVQRHAVQSVSPSPSFSRPLSQRCIDYNIRSKRHLVSPEPYLSLPCHFAPHIPSPSLDTPYYRGPRQIHRISRRDFPVS